MQLIVILNHDLTELQLRDAETCLGVSRLVPMPPSVRKLWRQVPPDLPAIDGHLGPVRRWVAESARSGDYILVQGDFGATYIMVRFAFEQGLVPVYSTTVREAREIHDPNGSVQLQHTVKHRLFRQYGR